MKNYIKLAVLLTPFLLSGMKMTAKEQMPTEQKTCTMMKKGDKCCCPCMQQKHTKKHKKETKETKKHDTKKHKKHEQKSKKHSEKKVVEQK